MFSHAGHALSWAYNVSSTPIIKMSAINHMRGSSRTTRNLLLLGLTVEDIHKQASNIVGMVARLPEPEQREYIGGRFGNRLSRDDLRLLVLLASDVTGLGLEKIGAVYQITRGYFGGNMGYREVRRILSCRDQQAALVKSCLYDTLDMIHHRALADMTEVLQQKGLIASTASIPNHYNCQGNKDHKTY